MITTHNLGFPRIGPKRELKFALEAYWKGQSSREQLLAVGTRLRHMNWQTQAALDWIPVGDFSFYDQVLDTSALLGNLPQRVGHFNGDPLDNYFRVARGRSAPDADRADGCESGVAAAEMTKWFDTNYHYIVPEFTPDTQFNLDSGPLLESIRDATRAGLKAKPVIIGPLTYLALGKARDGCDKLSLLPRLLSVYRQLLEALADTGAEWVQIDEPILVTELAPGWEQAFETAYQELQTNRVKLLIATYFGTLQENLTLLARLPVAGVHIDAIAARNEVATVIDQLPTTRVISLGVVNGRNIWKTDLNRLLDWLEPVAEQLGERLWIAPSCSLLHVPVDLASEQQLDGELKQWLAFATQKLEELCVIKAALESGRASVQAELTANGNAIASRATSPRVVDQAVQEAVNNVSVRSGLRSNTYHVRAKKQQAALNLPKFPTTTIGSFPQTSEIRRTRKKFKAGEIDEATYRATIQAEIARCVREQESLGLDVLVHGEAERNDMVEYFGEQLNGFAFSQHGWVQSYGSRCVKPPILFGDVSRPKPMTVDWITYAQSLTKQPLKGMLTGPVTILNWSFVRDDQPRSLTCRQLALAIREEVADLEHAGVRIIQIDEAALREGLPLRKGQWHHYLDWAVDAFRIAANGVADETQIHTHMCYSEFNDIIEAIAELDADVITIETSRSNMELLEAFENFHYPNGIGPGVYDIHVPNIPSEEEMIRLIERAAEKIPAERLWLNPDCGLKTRQWHEVIPALANLVSAARRLRASAEGGFNAPHGR